jgi:hypothetical protein
MFATLNAVHSKSAQASQTIGVAEQQNKFIGKTKLYVGPDAVKVVLQGEEV